MPTIKLPAARLAAVGLLFASGFPGATVGRAEPLGGPTSTVVSAQLESDVDRDGVPNAQDACPWTPPRAILITRGCAPVDLVRNAEVITGPVLAVAGAARRGVDAEPVLGEAKRLLDVASLQVGQAQQSLLVQGRVCDAATSLTRAGESMAAAQAITMRTAPQVQTQTLLDDPESDVDSADYGVESLLIREALAGARSGQALLDVACAAVAAPFATSGTVANTADAAGVLVMADGRSLAMPLRHYASFAQGSTVRASGVLFKDGSGVIYDLGTDSGSTVYDPAAVQPIECMVLRVVPVQAGLAPYPAEATTITHAPAAYRQPNGTMHYLEKKMGLAAHDAGCPAFVGADKESSVRYSLDLQLGYHLFEGAPEQSVTTLANDLVPSDGPVFFPSDAGGSFVHQLTVTVRKQICTPVQTALLCTTPTTISKQQLWITLQPTGTYCSTVYDQVDFAIEDGDFVTARPARVIDLKLDGSLAGTPAVFEADGYAYPAGKSGGLVQIHQGDGFAVYRDDFYAEPPSQFQLFDQFDAVGVDHPAGLEWPRIAGKRNGALFRYSCEAPTLFKDAVYVPDASQIFDQVSYYRLPWAGGAAYKTTQGNNGTYTHKGKQAYAFDFGLPAGGKIRAARGGTVKNLEESRTLNCNSSQGCNPTTACAASVPLANNPCKANYVLIEHDDGTFAAYYHMPFGGVWVNVGDHVKRGDVLGTVGQTGYSTGPHLHFHVQVSPTNGKTLPTCFEIAGSSDLSHCVVPQKGDVTTSTNAAD